MCSPSTGDSQLDFLAAFISESCNKTRVLVVIQGVGSVVSDLFLLILPLPAVWKLNMPIKRKLAVSSIFLVGIRSVWPLTFHACLEVFTDHKQCSYI